MKSDGNGNCYLQIELSENSENTLGMSFLRNFYMVFNSASNSISIAASKCASAKVETIHRPYSTWKIVLICLASGLILICLVLVCLRCRQEPEVIFARKEVKKNEEGEVKKETDVTKATEAKKAPGVINSGK